MSPEPNPDALTLVFGSDSLAKTVQVINGIVTRVDDPYWPKLVSFGEIGAGDPGKLLTLLRDAAGLDPSPCVVRAAPLAAQGRRALYASEDGPAGMVVMPRRWAAYDIERVPADGIDPLNAPEAAVAKARQCLPPEHHDVSVVFQITASAGKRANQLRLRLWFLLDRPLLGKQLAAWCQPGIESGWLDPCTLKNEVLPHFIGIIRITGNSPDPCRLRWGLIPGARDRVPVPDHVLVLPERQTAALGALAALAGGDPAEREAELRTRYGRYLGARRQDAVREIRLEIEAVRSCGPGARHPSYVHAASRIYGLCEFWAIPLEEPRDLLVDAYRETLTPDEARRRERGSINGIWHGKEKINGRLRLRKSLCQCRQGRTAAPADAGLAAGRAVPSRGVGADLGRGGAGDQ
jgi:hypothetical protein